MATPYTVSVVCSGNICRSPIGEVLLREGLDLAGLGEQVTVTSAGTGDWHLGQDMDHRAREVLTETGHDVGQHRATQFRPEDFADVDLILAMDHQNAADLLALAPDEGSREKVRLLRAFDPALDGDADLAVPDPYYGGPDGFAEVFDMVEAACAGLLDHIADRLPPAP